MSNDAAREQAADVLAGLQNQLADIAAVQKKQTELRVDAQAADGNVEVTVNARGQLVKLVIDKSYLDDHDFDELGDCIVETAQTAAQDAGQRVAEMMAPINERHKLLPTFSDVVAGVPEPADLMPPGSAGSSAGAVYDDGDEGGAEFPVVRRRTGG